VSQSAGEAVTPVYRRYVLGLLFVVYVFNFIDRQILGILLQPIKRELSLSDTELGFLSGIAFALFYSTLGIPIGRWADRGSRRIIITLSLALWSLMTAVSGLARNFLQLALARVAVGVGEAGCTPPSHSLLSDYYPAKHRATALSIYSLGIPVGILFGYLLGGWINEFFGWRVAFFVVGLPGLLLAGVVHFTLREPPRGQADGLRVSGPPPPIGEVGRLLWSLRTLRHICLGTSLLAFTVYGTSVWNPAFLERSHGMSSGEIGTWLAAIAGLGGGTGTFLGGFLADRLSVRDVRWAPRVPALAALAAIPMAVGFYLYPSKIPALALGFAPTFLAYFHIGPAFAMTQSLVPLHTRAVAAAILLFVINMIGLGLGPQAVGIASDALYSRFGEDSLRYALLLSVVPVYAWSAVHFLLAARTLREELAETRRRYSERSR
jgi:MFS family permease